MKHTTIIFLFIFFSASKSHSQTDLPSAGLLCISDCATCPVICSPPPSPSSSSSSPPPSPKLPPLLPAPAPPVHHYTPPQIPYYFDSPSPSSSPLALPPPSSGGSAPRPPYSSGGGPPPPQVYVYNPGTTAPSGLGPQRNFSFPYYYFYASKASSCLLPLHYQGFVVLMFTFFQFFV